VSVSAREGVESVGNRYGCSEFEPIEIALSRPEPEPAATRIMPVIVMTRDAAKDLEIARNVPLSVE
jgi:hypothetical protein